MDTKTHDRAVARVDRSPERRRTEGVEVCGHCSPEKPGSSWASAELRSQTAGVLYWSVEFK